MQIDRSKWLCGGRYARSVLYLEAEDKYCCLGFLGCHLGADKKEFLYYYENRCFIADLPSDVKSVCNWPQKLFEETEVYRPLNRRWHRRWQGILAKINDDACIDNETRESWIAAGFKILFDIDVEFVGEY